MFKVPDKDDIVKNPNKYLSHQIKRDYPEFYESLDKTLPIREAMYVYFYGEHVCPICGKTTKFLNFREGYRKYCSTKCRSNDPEVQNKIKQTNLERYGGAGMASQVLANKMKQTTLERYGDEKYRNKEQALETNLERYGGIGMASAELAAKTKQTNLEKYGTQYTFQAESVKEKSKQTNLERYGVENPMQNASVRDKFNKTCLEKYGTEEALCSHEIRSKIKNTNLVRYKHISPFGSRDVQRKAIKTTFERYGVENVFSSYEIQNKIKQTNISRYRVDNPMRNKHIKTRAIDTFKKEFVQNNVINVIGYTGDGDWIVKCPHPGRDSHLECSRCTEKTFVTNRDVYKSRLSHGTELCTRIQPIGSNDSTGERELFEFISSIYSGTILRGWNGLYFDTSQPKQIDVYLPELKIGFEFNGIYYHSLESKAPSYHFKKWKAAKELGIRLITIWDFQWAEDRENIESFIRKVLEGDRNAKYGSRVNEVGETVISLDGCSYNEWVDVNPDDIVLEKRMYDQWTYVDSGTFFHCEP